MTPNTQQEKILKEFHALYQKYGIPSEKRLTEWLSTALSEVAEKAREIDHSIDVRYEQDILVAFNKFITKWCGEYAEHLLDTDEQDGQYMREKISALIDKLSSKEGEGK